MRQKALLAALLAAACGLLAAIAPRFGPSERLELRTLDARFRLFPRPQRASPEVVIVDADDKSLEEFQRRGVAWPWPRDYDADLASLLKRAGAEAVVFDGFYSEPDFLRPGRRAGDSDRKFAAAMKKAGNVVLATEMISHKLLALSDNPLVRPPRLQVRLRDRSHDAGGYAVLPLALFQESAAMLGFKNYTQDEDGTCRRQHLLIVQHGNPFPQLALAAYLTARKIDRVEFARPDLLAAGDALVPLDARGNFLIFWYGPDSRTFRHYSFSDLVTPGGGTGTGMASAAARAAFQGKIVVVGVTAHGVINNHITPYTIDFSSSYSEVLATLVSNLLQRDFLVRAPPAVPVAAAFLLAALVSALFLFGPGLLPVALAASGGAVAWLALAAWLFVSRGVWLDIVAPLAALGLAFAAAAAVSYQVEGKARRRLRAVFNRYVSPVVISQILERREDLELDGQEVTGTAFFSDLKDFTTLSEKLPPREIVAFLNEYFSLASAVIMEHDGLIDKYIGDAIMAVFGAPIPSRSHAANACAAALELRRRLTESGRPAWATRMGIHSGPMVAGNIGSPQRLDYTAIGDTVNIASRLEGANKLYGTSILVSEAVLREAGERFESRELDLLAVKGRSQALRVYELLGRRGEVPQEVLACKRSFEAGLSLFRARDFARALAAFEALRAGRPEDGPALLYVERCRAFLLAPPPPDWDGANRLTSK